MDITLKEIVEINKSLGGRLRSDSSIDFALHAGRGRSLYWRIALLLRAILVDHPFVDFNKRTALVVLLTMLERNSVFLSAEGKYRVDREISKIVRDNVTSVKLIERRVRYAATGH